MGKLLVIALVIIVAGCFYAFYKALTSKESALHRLQKTYLKERKRALAASEAGKVEEAKMYFEMADFTKSQIVKLFNEIYPTHKELK